MFASRNRVISYRHRAFTSALALVLGVLATAAYAQKYETIPVKLDPKEMNRLKADLTAALRNPAGFGASQQGVDDYLKKGLFPKMTGYSPESLGELAGHREDLFKYIATAANPSSQQYLIELTFNVSRVLARGDYHPAVRYNAVLMLGELDQQLATAANPPVPHPKATQELLELVEKDSFKNQKGATIPVPESVKLGAVLGLERHTRYGVAPQLAERLTKALIGVMASKTPEDVDADVHDWTRSSAALALANQYAKAPTKEVQAALTALIADQEVELDDRCATAGAMKKITYAAGADIDGKATTDALGQLTMDVITNAAKLAEEFNEEALGTTDLSNMGGGGRGGYGGGRGGYGGGRGGYGGMDDEEKGPQFERRQLFAQLHNIGAGSSSLKAALADDSKARLEELIATLGPVMQTMDSKDAAEVDVTQEVLKLQATLKTLIEGWGKPVAVDNKPADGLATK